MSEKQKPVPVDVRIEALNLEIEQLQEALAEAGGFIIVLTNRNDTMSSLGIVLMKGLSRIKKIKGNPPIEVARTIASETIDECEEIVKNEMEQDEQEPTDNHTFLCEHGAAPGPEEHGSGHVPGRAIGPSGNGEQGAGV